MEVQKREGVENGKGSRGVGVELGMGRNRWANFSAEDRNFPKLFFVFELCLALISHFLRSLANLLICLICGF